MNDTCQACGRSREGSLFECPHCGAMPSKAEVRELSGSMSLMQRLAEGEPRDVLIEELVADGLPVDEAIARVREADASRTAANAGYRSHTALLKTQQNTLVIYGVVLVGIAGVIAFFTGGLLLKEVLLFFGGPVVFFAMYRVTVRFLNNE